MQVLHEVVYSFYFHLMQVTIREPEEQISIQTVKLLVVYHSLTKTQTHREICSSDSWANNSVHGIDFNIFLSCITQQQTTNSTKSFRED